MAAITIGGHQAAACLGLDPRCTRLRLYQRLIGEAPPVQDSFVLRSGRHMEQLISEEYARVNDVLVGVIAESIYHPDFPWMRATIDRVICPLSEPHYVLECKYGLGFFKEDWGDEDSDQVPDRVIVQVQQYMAVGRATGICPADYAWIATAIGGKYRQYRVEHDREIVEAIMAAEEEMIDRVSRRLPPDPIGIEDIKLRWPRSMGKPIVAENRIVSCLSKLLEIREDIEFLTDEKEKQESSIKKFLGECDTLLSHDGQVLATWKTNRDSTVFDKERFAAEHPDLYSKYLVSKTGARQFLVKKK
ncbi:MAG: YqaJ viral recombinase family protein [Nitrososphaera sp.]|nr:YqaJ viral recombinase family protein [Nitrososphaera sp.]